MKILERLSTDPVPYAIRIAVVALFATLALMLVLS